jgi:hypothetical protein
MDATEIAGHCDAIVDYVTRYDYVTFIEIARQLEKRGVETKGHQALCLPDDPNMILWAGMSADFVAVYHVLHESKRIYPHPAQYLTYLIDGGTLRMPIAQRAPKAGYREPHWVPVCFRTVPWDEKEWKRERRARRSGRRRRA